MPINLLKSKNLNYCVFVFSFFIVSNFVGNVQVGIGNSNPDSSSIFYKVTSDRNSTLNSATRLLIYNTKNSIGDYNSFFNLLQFLLIKNTYPSRNSDAEQFGLGKKSLENTIKVSDLTSFFFGKYYSYF